LHAQHRSEHRNLHGYHADCAPLTISSGISCDPFHARTAGIHALPQESLESVGCFRFGGFAGDEPGICETLSGFDSRGDQSRLHRHVLGAGCGSSGYVSTVLRAQKKSTWGWRGGGGALRFMTIRIITLDREYGSGGAVIAEKVASRLGWKLWDQLL